MADIALDLITGDILIEDNELSLIDGDDAILQQLKIRLRFFRGEWFLDQRVGIPYIQDILIKNPNLVAIRTLFREAILGTPGVDGIERFDLTVDDLSRKLRVDFAAKKADGEILDYSMEFVIG